MNRFEEYALFLGMLSGDGCLAIAHNGEGYRNYPIDFCNTEKYKVLLFDKLFFDLFGLHGTINSRQRVNRKKIWGFRKFSVKIAKEIKGFGFPEGVKRDLLCIPNRIKEGSQKEKLAFIYGFLITDGSVGDRRILFHSGSKRFLNELSDLISEFIGNRKTIKEYVQKNKYKSYQLCLNKEEKNKILSMCPRATMVLGRS